MIAQGDREYQQDAVRTVANGDGSWVIAVADGTGGGINTEEIAPAAVAALLRQVSGEVSSATIEALDVPPMHSVRL